MTLVLLVAMTVVCMLFSDKMYQKDHSFVASAVSFIAGVIFVFAILEMME